MASVNKATILGTLGQSPEVKFTKNGKKYCLLSVATNQHWKDKTTGERKSEATWHNVKLYDALAENCANYTKKGDLIYIEGLMKNDTYEKDGEQKTFYYILGNVVQFIGKVEKSEDKPANKGAVYVDKNNDTAFLNQAFINDEIPF